MTDLGAHWAAEFRRLAGEPPAEARRAAFDEFVRKGVPAARDENWKYARFAALEKRPFHAVTARVDTAACQALLAGIPAPRIVWVDGRFEPQLSQMPGKATGIAVAQVPPVIPAVHADGLHALHSALNVAHLRLRVAAGADAGSVHLVFLATESGAMSHTGVDVEVGAGAKLALAEHHIGPGAGSFVHVRTSLDLGAGARVSHVRLQALEPACQHIGHLGARLADDAQLAARTYAFGAGVARMQTDVSLAAPGATVNVDGLYLVDGRRQADHAVRIEHAAPRCTSHQRLRGVLGGAGRGAYTGRVIVARDAQQTEADQNTRSLLLSEQAEADVRPQLEIHADDVKCAHGATVGQIDAQELFYLRSRGLDERTARTLLVAGFARELVEAIDDAALREQVEARLQQALDALTGGAA